MRRGVLGLDLLPGVGDPMCPWRVKSNGDYEWERCSSDCKVVGEGGSHPGQEISFQRVDQLYLAQICNSNLDKFI